MEIDKKLMESTRLRIAEGNKHLESIKGKKPVQVFDWMDDSSHTEYVEYGKEETNEAKK